jgi:hypothetical protein
MSEICYECDSNCVNTAFCYEGGSYGSNISLPKRLNITIHANPAYWGFSGVLFSGEVEYGAGQFDYWDNFNETYSSYKDCNSTTTGPHINEQRPDVAYRSVYDPDTGTITYNGTSEIEEIGGPSIYLLDKTPTKTVDYPSCDETDPEDVFKKNPTNFGLGNKILFQDNIYKNLTAAWRGVESGVVSDINKLPGGAVVGEYAGSVLSSGIFRESSTTNFVQAKFSYNGVAASGLKTGQRVFIQGMDNSSISDGNYHIFNLTHNSDHTLAYLTGTFGETDFADTGNILWVAPGTYDEKSCQSEKAYGVDYVNKCLLDEPNYHSDFGTVINDSRNRIHSNRSDRDFAGLQNTRQYSDRPRRDFTHVAIQEDGYALLTKEEVAHSVELGCAVGVWNPEWSYIYTSGDTHLSSLTAQEITDTGVAFTVASICGSGTVLGICDIDPLPSGWTKFEVDENVIPMHSRELPFYGPLYETYNYDNTIRHDKKDNTIVGRNGTCCTQVASLEVFPDCLVQSIPYTQCGGVDTNKINTVPRLTFVYRGFNYNDHCTYSDSGTPYFEPTSIDDLKNGIGGQEIYMYINLADVWAGEIARDPCACIDPPPGTQVPQTVQVKSPVTFPCFPKFDIRPDSYGAQDDLWKKYAANILGTDLNAFDLTCPIEATGNYSFINQPYTTYGFIRNLCGKETRSTKEAIKSLANQNTGAYRNTTPSVEIDEPMYWDFDQQSDVYSSGLSYAIQDSGINSAWGILDSQGRLVAPYYTISEGEKYLYCDPQTLEKTYADFDVATALVGNWPTDEVPFLITIDHDDNCVGCTLTNMSNKDLSITFTSLNTEYTHDASNKWGYNHCNYPGIAYEASYGCESGFALNVCDSGATSASTPYTSGTCDCINTTVPLVPTYLKGTNTPKYLATSGTNSKNSYVALSGCSFLNSNTYDFNSFLSDTYLAVDGWEGVQGAIPYVSAKLSCTNGFGYYFSSIAEGLDDFYSCGTCSISYPGVNNRPNLSLDYMIVNPTTAFLFEQMEPDAIQLLSSQLELGFQAYMCADYRDDCCTLSASQTCSDDLGGCRSLETNLPGCSGSTITLYGCEEQPGDWGDTTPPPPCPSGLYDSGCFVYNDCGNTYGYLDSGVLVHAGIRRSRKCGCSCVGKYDEMARYSYHEEYTCASGTIYGAWILDYINIDVTGQALVSIPTFDFSATNIPGIGDIPIMPNGVPIAKSIFPSNGTIEAACSWKGDLSKNNKAEVTNKFTQVGIADDVSSDPCSSLYPYTCDYPGTLCTNDNSVGRGNCKNPIPLGGTSVDVRRKNAQPEIMIVNKIECLDTGYKLHVSREYHEHNRAWQYPLDGHVCEGYLGAIDGGGFQYVLVPSGCDEVDCIEYYNDPCSDATALSNATANSGAGDSIYGPKSNYYVVPQATPSDMVTPVYPTKDDLSTGMSMCSNHPSSGDYPDHWVSRDFHTVEPFNSRYIEWSPIVGTSGEFLQLPLFNGDAYSSGCLAQPSGSPVSCSGSGPIYTVYYGFSVSEHAQSGDYIYVEDRVPGDPSSVLSTYTYKVENVIPTSGVELLYVSDSNDLGDSSPCDLCDGTGSSASCGGITPHDFSKNKVVWKQLQKMPLTSAQVGSLEDCSSGVHTRVIGTGICSGFEWASPTGISLSQLTSSDGSVRYFYDDGTAGACSPGQYYPDLVGKQIWSYYNLFYGSGLPDSSYYNYAEYVEGQGLVVDNQDNSNFGPLFDSGTDIPLTRKHSCLQDLTSCGGDIWNNKMFFPRKHYESGTRVTAFGALSLCTDNNQLESASWLEGYEDFYTENDLLKEAKLKGFIDACDATAHSVTLQSDCGIDDAYIIVDDYLPLLGIYSVEIKHDFGDNTCIFADTGCLELYPIHTNDTIKKMTFVPPETLIPHHNDSMGYYLDKTVTSGVDECLFKPFKVMVDVECCSDNIRRFGNESDDYDPTYMSWIATNVPSLICNGHVSYPQCGCENTSCFLKFKPDACFTLNAYYEQFPPTVPDASCDELVSWASGCGPGVSGCDPCDTGVVAFSGTYHVPTTTHPVFLLELNSGVSEETTTFGYSTSSETCSVYDASGIPISSTKKCIVDATYEVIIYEGRYLTFLQSYNIPAVKCGNNYFIHSDLQSSATPTCCTLPSFNLCSMFPESYKIPEGTGIYELSGSGTQITDNSENIWDCPCMGYALGNMYSACDTPSNVLIEITEDP